MNTDDNPRTSERFSLLLADLLIKDRLRLVDEDHARLIADSFQTAGQIAPIEVRPDPKKEGRFLLVAGAHRVAAAHILGWTEIAAVVFDGSSDQARMREIDENLCRRELSALDRSFFLRERQSVYERINPTTKGRKHSANVRWHTSDSVSFASDVANKLGISRRTIERALELTTICEDARTRLKGSPFADNAAQLIVLAKLDPEEQKKVVDVLMRAERPCGNVAAALREVRGDTVAANDTDLTVMYLKSLNSAWAKADEDARSQFLELLEETGALRDYVREAA